MDRRCRRRRRSGCPRAPPREAPRATGPQKEAALSSLHLRQPLTPPETGAGGEDRQQQGGPQRAERQGIGVLAPELGSVRVGRGGIVILLAAGKEPAPRRRRDQEL